MQGLWIQSDKIWKKVKKTRNNREMIKMKKERISMPQHRSTFLLVKCQKCDNEQIVYSMTNSDIKCKICEDYIAKKTGGKAIISGIVLRRLD